MISQLTSSHEAISPPVLVTEASTLVPVSRPPCEIITVRLAQLDQGDFDNQWPVKSYNLIAKVRARSPTWGPVSGSGLWSHPASRCCPASASSSLQLAVTVSRRIWRLASVGTSQARVSQVTWPGEWSTSGTWLPAPPTPSSSGRGRRRCGEGGVRLRAYTRWQGTFKKGQSLTPTFRLNLMSWIKVQQCWRKFARLHLI